MVFAFHSFKGGVGRTLHTLALTKSLVDRGKKVLLIDGDFEAPGISWMFERRLPRPPIGYADVLALVQGDESEELTETIELVCDRLLNAKVDDVYVLPAFRGKGRWNTLAIRPEHVAMRDQPFLLTELFARVGAKLEVDAVVFDLRAGLSELSTPVLLDPRVSRVFVTSTSEQSLAGTEETLSLLSHYAPAAREGYPLPSLLISHVPLRDMEDSSRNGVERLLEAAEPAVRSSSSEGDRDVVDMIPVMRSVFQPDLMSLPLDWEAVLGICKATRLVDVVQPLAEMLEAEEEDPAEKPAEVLDAKRQALADLAAKMQYAESGEGGQFLKTRPLKRLAADHQHDLPRILMIGAKGAGKTYVYLKLVEGGSWSEYLSHFGHSTDLNASVFPLLKPRQLERYAKEMLADATKKVEGVLGQAMSYEGMVDEVRKAYTGSTEMHDGQWRDFWLDLMAWRCGHRNSEPGAGRELAKVLNEKGLSLVFVVDGLEDLFQEIETNVAQQVALRALLVDVPDWFSQSPYSNVGLIVFVRQDLVGYAIRQNLGQLFALYESYRLRWSDEEALRLVAWLAVKAKVLEGLTEERVHEMAEDELREQLYALWGYKLGTMKSREARTARWVIDVLSDLNHQLQARDVVRLLHHGAKGSLGDDKYFDRVLAPGAMRAAVAECSRQKIEEVKQENKSLREVLGKLEQSQDSKTIPFTREEFDLSPEDLTVLITNGVVLDDQGKIYMPEIYREGLGFSYSNRGRAGVRKLKMRAKN